MPVKVKKSHVRLENCISSIPYPAKVFVNKKDSMLSEPFYTREAGMIFLRALIETGSINAVDAERFKLEIESTDLPETEEDFQVMLTCDCTGAWNLNSVLGSIYAIVARDTPKNLLLRILSGIGRMTDEQRIAGAVRWLKNCRYDFPDPENIIALLDPKFANRALEEIQKFRAEQSDEDARLYEIIDALEATGAAHPVVLTGK